MSKNMDKQLPVIIFLFGFIFRLSIELAFGMFPIGFDTNAYYTIFLMRLNIIEVFFAAPLYYWILVIFFPLGIFGIKLLGSLLVGALILSYFYFLRSLDFSEKDSAVFSIVLFFTIFSLRLTWDLHRNVLGFTLVLFALAYRDLNVKKATFFAFLSGLAHQTTIFISASFLVPQLLKRNLNAVKIFVGNAISWGSVVLSPYIFKKEYNLLKTTSIANIQPYVSSVNLILFLVWLALPYMVFILTGLKTLIEKKNWKENEILTMFLGLLTASFIASLGYRFIILSIFPLLIIALHNKKLSRTFIIFSIVWGATYIALPNPYYVSPPDPNYRYAVPTRYFEGSLPRESLYSAYELLKDAKSFLNESATIVLHYALASAAYQAGYKYNEVIWVKPNLVFDEYLTNALENYTIVYLVWFYNKTGWHNIKEVPSGYKIIKKIGDMALYEYTENNQYN